MKKNLIFAVLPLLLIFNTVGVYGQTATDANKRGLAALDQKDYDNAIAEFTEAIKLNPNNAVFYFNSGIAYYQKNDYDNAIANFTKAIQLNPNDADVYAYRGYAYFRIKDKDSALADANSAKRIDPDNKTAKDLFSALKEDNFSLIIYLCVFLFIIISFSFIIYKYIISPIIERKKAKQIMKDERFKNAKLFKMEHPIVVSLDGFIGIVKSKKIKIINIKDIKGFRISFDGRIVENDTGDLLFNNILLKLGQHLIERTEDIYLQLEMADNTLLKTYLLEKNATKRGGGRHSRGIRYTNTIPFYTQNDLKELFGMLESVEKSVKGQS